MKFTRFRSSVTHLANV